LHLAHLRVARGHTNRRPCQGWEDPLEYAEHDTRVRRTSEERLQRDRFRKWRTVTFHLATRLILVASFDPNVALSQVLWTRGTMSSGSRHRPPVTGNPPTTLAPLLTRPRPVSGLPRLSHCGRRLAA
jgi:hypothetical protein